MATFQDDEQLRRRRPRDIAFFDHGHEYSFAQRARDGADKMKQGALNAKEYLVYGFPVARVLFATFTVVFLTLTFIGFSLRGYGVACKHIPSVMPYCSRPYIALQEPLLHRMPPGTTPITKTLMELTKLNNLSPSLESVGLALHLVATNVSETIAEFNKNPEVFQIDKGDIEALAAASDASVTMVEHFSQADYYYRHSNLLWNTNGLNDISKKNHFNLLNINESSSLALTEHFLHRIPFGVTLAANCMNDYLYFTGEQWLAIEQVVNVTGQATLTLGDFLSSLGKLERRLEDVVSERQRFCASEHADATSCATDPSSVLERAGMMRASIQWAQDVMKTAETHYKDLFSEVRTSALALQAEVRSHGKWIPSKGKLSLRRLEEMMKVEAAQVLAFTENQDRVEKLVAEIEQQLMSGDVKNRDMAIKFETALKNRQVTDWW